MQNNKPILLVESKDEDAKVIELALKDVHVTNCLERKVNGQEALTYLKEGHHSKPCMILLDINSQQMETLELFRTVKADTKLKEIPVIIMVSSEADEDAIRSFGIDVAGFIQKPFDYKQFIEAMRMQGIHWILSDAEDG